MNPIARKGMYKLFFQILPALSIPTLLSIGCGEAELKSSWRKAEVMIDGRNTEWRDSLTTLGGQHISLGLMNDSVYMYLGLITTDRTLQRQIMRQGITLWFDREGGKDRKFGIHYPIGGLGPGRNGEESGGEEGGEFPREGFGTAPGDVEIYGPSGTDHEQMTLMQTGGIDARSQISNGILVYEMKIPLSDKGDHPFAIGTRPGSTIGIGFETSGGRTSLRPQLENSGDADGGRTGMGRGDRGGRGMPPSGNRAEPMNVWTKVTLAERDSSSQ